MTVGIAVIYRTAQVGTLDPNDQLSAGGVMLLGSVPPVVTLTVALLRKVTADALSAASVAQELVQLEEIAR